MAIGVFDLFKIGIGPSSSHTVGPMRAAQRFVGHLDDDGRLASVARVAVELYGSLGATGKGHGTDKAVILGLEGEAPDRIDTDSIDARLAKVRANGELQLAGKQAVAFREDHDFKFHKRQSLPFHPNGMRCTAYDAGGAVLLSKVYYSVGGGFVVEDGVVVNVEADDVAVPYPFASGAELLAQCANSGLSVSALMLENEKARLPESEIRARLLEIWKVMRSCIDRGCRREGVLAGGLQVRRRAATLYRRLAGADGSVRDPLRGMDWVNLYAIAVNEENAAGGRVVTAPTNGAAGIIPAVLRYYTDFIPGADDDNIVRFLLTAAAIGLLYKQKASISGAEVGCQGEVGVACSMAAGAFAEVLGGTPRQVENAAEIGMEHNLGLTCDPIGGLVQVPCIERNAMGAVKAINAARMAMSGDGQHYVSLDKVIATMRQTGADMNVKYKETARGGLAVNIIEC
ncbi:L-serine ammonia-lyase [Solimonas marina]|uniref:L-serine dehydratase n=1 Tax=Solimonas marina TaxID=2714601 RepID=A0A970B4B2_9GAMM|nr:L-serine ammonia-lyase [Solimonas marina]NKF22147.1 L-serine ammonia-lyase [Solimonas marina]